MKSIQFQKRERHRFALKNMSLAHAHFLSILQDRENEVVDGFSIRTFDAIELAHNAIQLAIDMYMADVERLQK